MDGVRFLYCVLCISYNGPGSILELRTIDYHTITNLLSIISKTFLIRGTETDGETWGQKTVGKVYWIEHREEVVDGTSVNLHSKITGGGSHIH